MKEENTKTTVSKNKAEVDIKTLNIYQKMSLATNEIATVIKSLTVGEGKNSYKAVSDKDVNNAVKPIETKYGIYSYPYERKIREETRETFTTKYGSNLNFVIKLETIYRFVNVDKPEEFIDITTYGYGIDSQDKASGKAMTYSDKYALLKAYKIETGEDPDKDKSVEIIAEEINNHPNKVVNAEPNYKQMLMNKLVDLGIDVTKYAQENKVNSKTTQEEAKKLLEGLEK